MSTQTAVSFTSDINSIKVGTGKDQTEIWTATRVTATQTDDGDKTYKVEIVQYNDPKGNGGRVIGERDGTKVNWNNNLEEKYSDHANITDKIKQVSSTQAKTLEKNTDLVTNSAESRAFHKANGNGNVGDEAGEPTLTSIDQASNIMNSAAGEGADGTRENGFPSGLVYPETLRKDRGGQDFLKFDMMKYEPRNFDSDNFSMSERSTDIDKRSIGSVILPIPGGIQDGQAVTWGGQTMTPLDMALANAALTGVTKGIGAMAGEIGEAAGKLGAGFDDNKDALAAVIAGMAAGGQQLLTRTTGAISNPNMELLFGGPNLRTFSFQWILAPRDQKEAKTVIRIIRFFKQGMAPIRTKSRLFMKSPHTFQLSYRNSNGEQHKYLNKFKECALQSFGVDYTPNGQYSTYEDGVMTAYKMSMTYSELNPIYNDDYGNKDEFGDDPAIGF